METILDTGKAKLIELNEVEKLQRELLGLYLILDDRDIHDPFISREYVQEKLLRIVQGSMGFHPEIKEHLSMENVNKWIKGDTNEISKE